MVVVLEYRIPLPYTLDEYRIGQLYSVATMSKDESGGGEGIEVLKNEPFENEMGKGQYTHKIYHVGKKAPTWAQKILPAQMLDFHEHAWNAYPYCKTVVSSPFLGEKFQISVTTIHAQDRGEAENIHKLDAETLKKRKVKVLDIANEKVDKYKKEDDPKLYMPTKVANRGPLTTANWTKTLPTMMCAYKLVQVKCAIFGIQTKVEQKISEVQGTVFLLLHRRLYCRTDEWVGLTLEDIRQLEDKIQKELAEIFKKKAAPVKGPAPKATPGGLSKQPVKAVPGGLSQQKPAPTPVAATAPTSATTTSSTEESASVGSDINLAELEKALDDEETPQ